jgi:glycosyltransferase involved in cell wall biosynthesis
MKKILILQNKILHYRKSLYNCLSRYYNVTVLHSGSSSVSRQDLFNEVTCPASKLGPVWFQSGVIKEVTKDYFAIIAMMDVRWINNLIASYIYNKDAKFIWWGSWLTGKKIPDMIKIHQAKRDLTSIFYNKGAMRDFIDHGVPLDNLIVANNTFDVPNRLKSFECEDKKYLLFVGSLDERKQLDVLIEAFSKIRPKISESIKLIIIGSGLEKDRLKNISLSLGVDNRVEFLGKITDTDLLSHYYLKAIASVSFGQAGLAVLQSLAYGVPFVTKENAISGGEKTNIVHGQNGFFCKDNPASLEEYLLLLCNDLGLAKKIGRNAYNHYSNFCTIDHMVQAFREAIEGIGFPNNG